MSNDIKTVGIIGAGQMGSGIAHVSAIAGINVILHDIDDDKIKSGLATIQGNLSRQVLKEKITEQEKEKALKLISSSVDAASLSKADLVIEAATENEKIKCEIYKKITPFMKKDAILATNTSSISITRLASTTDRPDRFLGIHFMNPVPVMKLVELIKGIATSSETFERSVNYVNKLEKQIAISEDYPAFIVNRILIPMINEAIYALYEGVGTIESIDLSMELGANHPMGPLKLADFIGLDTCLAIMQVLHDGLSDSKYRPCPLLVKYVEAGWLGRKTNRGFYDYTQETPKPTR